jgi:hypothetical protein
MLPQGWTHVEITLPEYHIKLGGMSPQDWAYVEATLPEYRIELGRKLKRRSWKKGSRLGQYGINLPGKRDQEKFTNCLQSYKTRLTSLVYADSSLSKPLYF